MGDLSTGKYWTRSWSPSTGCSPIDDPDQPCAHCWATGLVKLRPQATRGAGFTPTFHPELLLVPARWRTSQVVFASIMGDWCHEAFTDGQIGQQLSAMACAPKSQFLTCTKRPERLVSLWRRKQAWGFTGMTAPNIWLGTTIWNQPSANRNIAYLSAVPGKHWLSVEPLLGPIDSLNLDGIGWVAVGCESGSGHRPCWRVWIEKVVSQCQTAGVPVWVKAIEVRGKVSHNMSEWPEWARLRQLPAELEAILQPKGTR